MNTKSSIVNAAERISAALPTLLPYTDPDAAVMHIEVMATLQAVNNAITALLAMYTVTDKSKQTQASLLHSIQDAADELECYVNGK